jgi:cytochrome b561
MKRHYNAAAIAMHWLIAALILTNIAIAWYFNTLTGTQKIQPFQLHKSIGICILLLSCLRLAWRLAVSPPPLPSYMRGWERALAQLVHTLFYVIMLGMPLSGWAAVSASPLIKIFPITLFGLVHWPAIAPLTSLPHDQMVAAGHLFDAVHSTLAKLAYGLIILHVAGALKHQFISNDDVVARMIPILRPRRATTGEA